MDDARYTELPEEIDIPAQATAELVAFMRMSRRGDVAAREIAAEIEATILLKRAVAAQRPQ